MQETITKQAKPLHCKNQMWNVLVCAVCACILKCGHLERCKKAENSQIHFSRHVEGCLGLGAGPRHSLVLQPPRAPGSPGGRGRAGAWSPASGAPSVAAASANTSPGPSLAKSFSLAETCVQNTLLKVTCWNAISKQRCWYNFNCACINTSDSALLKHLNLLH